MSKKTNNALSELGRRTAAPPISWLMRVKLERPKLVSLAAGFTDNESLPLAGSRRLMNELLRDQALGQAVVSFGERPNATLNPVDKWPTIPVSQTKQRLGAHDARLGFVQCVVDQSLCVLRATDAKVSAEKPPRDCL